MTSQLRCLLFSRSPYDAGGGMERVFKKLLSRLSSKQLDIRPLYTAEDRVSSQVAEQPFVFLALPRTHNRLPTLQSSVKVVRSLLTLVGLLIRTRPDVVNCHYADYTAAYFAFLKPFFRYRLVISAHGSDLMHPSSLDRVLLPYVLRTSDHIIGVSDDLCARARSIAGGNVQVTTIYNGIDYDFWSGGDRTPTDHPIIVSVGSLRRVKGHDVLLHAFRNVMWKAPTAELRIIGDGPEHKRLTRLATELKIAHRVTFCGWLPSEQVRAELNRATVFAFPSRREGLGLALIEAMAAGLPCVASHVGGIPEVVQNPRTGTLVSPEDPEALSKAITDLLSDRSYAELLAENARERAKVFNWDTAIDQYEEVFRSLI